MCVSVDIYVSTEVLRKVYFGRTADWGIWIEVKLSEANCGFLVVWKQKLKKLQQLPTEMKIGLKVEIYVSKN